MRTAIFQASFDQLDAIRDYVNRATLEAGMNEQGRCAMEMATDEACSNVIEHAYHGKNLGEIECMVEYDQNTFTIVIRDHGEPFDINSVPLPDLSNSLEERQVGGLGVFLIHELMDDVKYENKGELGNFLTLKRKITGTK